ncbi:MAG: isoprenyl transferase [Bacteroidales bacterium]|nr:isoprenyl transferase [Bacteroidales bacterium]MDZ4204584.1 isoprenyl transferase [Bacteroidales bacterium]
MDLKEKIDLEKLPVHVAIIMDGNGRWARMRGKHRVFGHEQGVISVRETAEAAAELGIKYLTLYAFSTENWNRPMQEVEALMELLVQTINLETKTLIDNNIRLLTIGDTQRLNHQCYAELQKAIATTASNTRMDLILALSYSSRWEITEAMKQIAAKVRTGALQPADITENMISSHLATADIPDPELLIRTSGEYRISNFMLWQSAYTEMYFTQTMWPDFRKNDLHAAIIDFQQRERRFGKLNEQLNTCKK